MKAIREGALIATRPFRQTGTNWHAHQTDFVLTLHSEQADDWALLPQRRHCCFLGRSRAFWIPTLVPDDRHYSVTDVREGALNITTTSPTKHPTPTTDNAPPTPSDT